MLIIFDIKNKTAEEERFSSFYYFSLESEYPGHPQKVEFRFYLSLKIVGHREDFEITNSC